VPPTLNPSLCFAQPQAIDVSSPEEMESTFRDWVVNRFDVCGAVPTVYAGRLLTAVWRSALRMCAHLVRGAFHAFMLLPFFKDSAGS
jgi:hypothetical protein